MVFSPQPSRIADEEAFRIDWEEGMYLKDMAEKYDVGLSYVSTHAMAIGLEPRRKLKKTQVALTGGRWVLGADRIQRWVERGQAGTRPRGGGRRRRQPL